MSPNTPTVTYGPYLLEKNWFTGTLISMILYGTRKKYRLHVRPPILTTLSVRLILGMLIVLFFKCMTALFNPVYRRGAGVKWGLVSYTVIMFSLVTVYTGTKGHILSISYIDNRNYPGVEGWLYPGPYGYLGATSYTAISLISRTAFNLNNWSADGLLVSSLFDAVVIRTGT